MRVKVALTADSVSQSDVRGRVCVVIDVLRATTTTVTALANGASRVIPVETPEEAVAVARERGCLLGGERNGLKIRGFDFGNSPLEYTPERVTGRSIAFTTTNGTRAVRACAASNELYLAAFVNAGQVKRLLEDEKRDILLVCAGARGRPTIEDTVCAGMLLEDMRLTDAQAAETVSSWRTHRADLLGMMKNLSHHGRSLIELGFERDIEFAARMNEYSLVPLREGDSIVRMHHG